MEEYVAFAFAVQRDVTIAWVGSVAQIGRLDNVFGRSYAAGFWGRVSGMLIPIGGFRTNAVAWGLAGFGVVCLLSANRLADWRALTFLGLALVVPSVVWLAADKWFSRPRGVLWWVLVVAAVALGVWGIALFPSK